MFDENIKFKYSWRPYQAKVLEEVDKFLDDKRVNIVAAPGSGKTVLGLELARKLGNPVIMLSPTVTIKNQWIDRFVTLFMPEGSEKPDWISDNVYKLSYFNSITYQGLHYAYKRKKQKNDIDENETDDEILQENFDADVDVKEYDLIEEIKKNKIKTIVLDEAHHLKSEWWQSLTNVIKELENITIISLTATPPYDVDYSEWQKYIGLCGNIDMEISVPELVQAKNLCPHQDYVYFSYPTEKEKAKIAEYEKNVKLLIEDLKQDKSIIEMLLNHPYIKETNKYIEEILDNTEFYSSVLIFLNATNNQITKEKVKVLGHNKPIPNLTTKWLEILVQNIIFSENEFFLQYVEIVDSIKSKLNKLGAIEKKKVVLANNPALQKYFVNSIGKLESINKIVDIEYNNLKNDLRMVILTDFLRKEYLFEEIIDVSKLGVFPIFINLIDKNIKIAILTGSIFMMPNSEKEKLLKNVAEKGIAEDDISFVHVDKVPNYSIVKTSEKNKNTLMKSIAKLFSDGDVNIIIGTKSLLGEGWDEPSINSLILASFVGSYVLSNQMRGRAIRTNDNPNKTANVWHLVCAADLNEEIIENSDYEMLKRRFNSFVGIGYNLDVLENGITRLDTIPKRFAENTINEYNNCIANISSDRNKMYNRWFELIDNFGGSKVKMTNQLETDKSNVRFNLCKIEPKGIIIFIVTFLLLLAFFALVEGTMNLLYVFIVFILTCIFNFKFVGQCIRKIRFGMPKKQMQLIVKAVVRSLCDSNIVKTKFDKIKMYSSENSTNTKITISLSGVTTHENNIILESLEEVFDDIESQRYIIVSEERGTIRYFNVPNLLSTNKELAERFHLNWGRYIGRAELYYTKSIEGRKILLKARKNSFDYTKSEKFMKKKKPVSDWK